MTSCHQIGVDEAGRGPLVGDMVVAGVMGEKSVFDTLVAHGLRDSKVLTPMKRKELYELLVRSVDAITIYIPSYELDSKNLNELELEKITEILKIFGSIASSRSYECVEIYIDEVKGVEEDLKRATIEAFRGEVKVVISSKADAIYPAVSAASIVAKVSRDLIIQSLKIVEGDFGSGYPADERTVRWLLELYRKQSKPPLYLRRSWRSLIKLAPKWYRDKRTRVQKTLLEYWQRFSENGDKSSGRSQG